MNGILQIATLILVGIVLVSGVWTLLSGSLLGFYITTGCFFGLVACCKKQASNKDQSIDKLLQDIVRKNRKIEDLAGDRAKLLSIVGHELKNIISGLNSTIIDIISDDNLDNRRDDLELVVHASKSVNQYIDDLVDYVAINKNQMVLREESFDIRKILNDAYELLVYEAKHYHTDLKIEIIEDSTPMPKYFIGDPERILQVYLGLGSRAIHFNKGGEVILKAEALKKQEQDTYKLYIQVADKSGVNHSPLANKNMNVGIKDNRFNMNNGLGLNIFLAQKLCENMGGEMLSDLDEDEIYHVFYGYIEIKSTDRRYLYENRQKNKRNCKRDYGKKILVVEDEITNAKIIEKVIISLGCTVRVTSNGEEALGMLASGEHNFDLILMDIHMPIMDGLVTTEHIRVGETIPIIALSANNTSKIKKLAEEKGMNGFLNKPVTKRLLVEELDKWFIQS